MVSRRPGHGKDIENRSWPTSYRGPVLIHASLNIEKTECRKRGLDPAALKTGGVVGMADIADCVSKHRSRWFGGPYGFVLKKRRPLPFVEWPGGLGLREAPKRLLNRLNLVAQARPNPGRRKNNR